MLQLRKPVLCALALALSACSGGAGSSLAPSAPFGPTAAAAPAKRTHKVTASITLTIPHRHKRGKHARYISPATQSMHVDIKQNTTTVSSSSFNVTPSSQGCAAVNSGTQCTISVSLAAGSYTASVAMYAGLNATGSVLSQGQNIAFTVSTAKANDVQLVLNGVPHGFVIAGADNDVFGSANGFTLFGPSARNVIVTATDASGNEIVGPGAPTYTTSLTDGSGWTVGSTTTSHPNAFAITPPGIKNNVAHVSVTANYDDDTCAQPGAVCTLTFPIVNDVQYLYVSYIPGIHGGADSVTKFALPYSGAASPTKYTNGIQHPSEITVAGGTMYVSNLHNVGIYTANSTSPLVLLSDANTQILKPQRVLVDNGGNVFVQYFEGGLYEFTGFSGTSAWLGSSTIGAANDIAMNANGDILRHRFARRCHRS